MTTTTPRRRAILLARLSDNREDLDLTDEGIPLSLEGHVRGMREVCERRGWDVYKLLLNPRLSAYKRRMVTLPDGRREYRVYRPDLREALALLWSGKADALVCLDLDRAFRDPKDLQDLIDVVENAPHSIEVDSVNGSLQLVRGRDNFDAEIRVLVARKSSSDTARRVAMARERQVLEGRYGGGRRPFGFCHGAPVIPPDTPASEAEGMVCPWHGGRDCRAGITIIEPEAEVIADCTKRLLNGVSLRSLAADLRSQNVPTVTGKPWSAETLRDILLRPRNAGLVVLRGKVLDNRPAPWRPIVSAEAFEAARTLLTDPTRRQGPGGAARWLGSGLYRCGVCSPADIPRESASRESGPVTCQVTLGSRSPRYRCKDHAHLTRNVEGSDQVVLAHMFYLVTHPRAYELLGPTGPDVDVAALRQERSNLKLRMEQQAEDEIDGLITRAARIKGAKRGNARIAEIDELLNASASGDPLADIINAKDPVAEWVALPVASQRALIDRLCTVTLLPLGRKGRGFDRSSVRVDPKHHLGPGERAENSAA